MCNCAIKEFKNTEYISCKHQTIRICKKKRVTCGEKFISPFLHPQPLQQAIINRKMANCSQNTLG